MYEFSNRSWRRLAAVAAAVALTVAAVPWPPAAKAGASGPHVESQSASRAPGALAAPVRAPRLTAPSERILGDRDIARYRRIEMLQYDGEWDAADLEIAALEDRILMGHVLLQRYLHPKKYRSRYGELKQWMDAYADHPGAIRIHRLAQKRRPKGYKQPSAPKAPGNLMSYADFATAKTYRSPRKRTKSQRLRLQAIKHQVRRNLRADRLSAAESYLQRADVRGVLDRVEMDGQLARIAGAWFYSGSDKKAYALAARAAQRSRAKLSYPDWIAGLAAWRLDDMDKAALHFEALAQSKVASPWNLAAGAFWAARAHLAARRPARVNPLLRVAARHYRTFYGLIAARQLGLELHFDWSMPAGDNELALKLYNLPAARRAIALAQTGRHEIAERELRLIYLRGDASLGPALLKLAYKLELPALQLRLARGLRRKLDGRYDKALFPLLPWRPVAGFSIDQALLFAVARQESGFDTRARSPAGARGLMQLMPRTASYVARDRSLRRGNRNMLYDPLINLELGQRYVAELLGNRKIRGDLFKFAIAYNAGPGNLNKWLRTIDHRDDPLLLIESIPSLETRIFVERVLSNFWIYRERLQQDTPSLDAVATGHAPIYLKLDSRGLKVADNGGR